MLENIQQLCVRTLHTKLLQPTSYFTEHTNLSGSHTYIDKITSIILLANMAHTEGILTNAVLYSAVIVSSVCLCVCERELHVCVCVCVCVCFRQCFLVWSLKFCLMTAFVWVYLFIPLFPDVILCGLLGLKHQLSNSYHFCWPWPDLKVTSVYEILNRSW